MAYAAASGVHGPVVTSGLFGVGAVVAAHYLRVMLIIRSAYRRTDD